MRSRNKDNETLNVHLDGTRCATRFMKKKMCQHCLRLRTVAVLRHFTYRTRQVVGLFCTKHFVS